LWPLSRNEHLSDFIGVWEYRHDHGTLKPKPQELAVDIACVTVIITSLIQDFIF
jgi:hypothetical protein